MDSSGSSAERAAAPIRRADRFGTAGVALVLGMLAFVALVGIDRVGEQQHADFVLADAVLDMQVKVSSAHVRFEEVIAGDPSGSSEAARGDLAAARGIAEALLGGEDTESGEPLRQLADPQLRARIGILKALLETFEAAAVERIGHSGGGDSGTPSYRRFHATYHEFQDQAAAFEQLVERDRLRARGQWRKYFSLIAAGWLGIVAATVAGIWSHERQRRAAETALQSANERLRQRTDELDRHKGRLTELVEERTARLSEAVRAYQQEIVERRQTEDSLRVSESRFRTLVENLPQAICLKDTQGVYLYCNATFAQEVGVPPEAVGGKTDHDFFAPDKAERYTAEDRRILETGGTEESEERATRDGRDAVFHRIKVPVRDERGEVVGVLVIIRDVTERMQFEAIAEAANTMENIGHVFAGIRHEIGNPVNAMKMTLSVLAEKVDSASPETIRGYLERIAGELARAEYLLRALKSFNMYETPDVQTVSVGAFLEKFVALVAEDYAKRGIRIERAVPGGELFGRFDPRALQQVLLNIVGNAADALEGRERPLIAIEARATDDRVRIAVTDNGHGMTPEQQRQLFKPFRTTRSGGTGLGLVIARKMMTKMNGMIEVRSRAGEGTTVLLTLPGAVS